MKEERWTKLTTEWIPNQKKKKGRHKRWWEEEIQDRAGGSWKDWYNLEPKINKSSTIKSSQPSPSPQLTSPNLRGLALKGWNGLSSLKCLKSRFDSYGERRNMVLKVEIHKSNFFIWINSPINILKSLISFASLSYFIQFSCTSFCRFKEASIYLKVM